MNPSEVASRIGRPTIQITTLALAIDLFSVLSFGKSPAFLDTATVISSIPVSVGYAAIIMALVALPVVMPIGLICLAANQIAYAVFTWPFRRCSSARTAIKFWRRRDFLKLEMVRNYALHEQHEELLERVEKQEKQGSQPSAYLPSVILVLLIWLWIVSSGDNPNFLMKVCSFDEPVTVCGRYSWIMSLAIFQTFFLMVLYGFLLRQSFWFPKRRLTVPVEDVRKHRHSDPLSDFRNARKSWLRGREDWSDEV